MIKDRQITAKELIEGGCSPQSTIVKKIDMLSNIAGELLFIYRNLDNGVSYTDALDFLIAIPETRDVFVKGLLNIIAKLKAEEAFAELASLYIKTYVNKNGSLRKRFKCPDDTEIIKLFNKHKSIEDAGFITSSLYCKPSQRCDWFVFFFNSIHRAEHSGIIKANDYTYRVTRGAIHDTYSKCFTTLKF